MKKVNQIMPSLMVALMFPIASVHAGGVSGGGGKGVLCGSKLLTLDLYEASEVYHLPLAPALADLDSNLKVFGPKLEAYFEENPIDPTDPQIVNRFMGDMRQQLLDQIIDIPQGKRLPPTDDATLPHLPAGCSFVQIIVYDDEINIPSELHTPGDVHRLTSQPQIYRDLELWNLLDAQNQAALLLHEVVYRGAREDGAKTSDETRRLIGLDFANQLPEPILKPIWNANVRLYCAGGFGHNQRPGDPVFVIYAVKETHDGNTGVGLYFPVFQGELKAGRVYSFMNGLTLDRLASQNAPVYVGLANDNLFNNIWNFVISGQSSGSDTLPTGASRDFYIQAWENSQPNSQSTYGYCFFER